MVQNELSKQEISFKPFSELIFAEDSVKNKGLFSNLLKFGGFPEIFLKQNDKQYPDHKRKQVFKRIGLIQA